LKWLFAIVVTCSPVCAAELSGAVERIDDGRTLTVAGQVVRLWGIDAPDLRQHCRNAEGDDYACGENARLALELLIGGKPVSCLSKGRDSAERIMAQCEAGGNDLGTLLVVTGRAIDFPPVSAGWYAEYEDGARSRRAGLWGGVFEMPWDWRRRDGLRKLNDGIKGQRKGDANL
jgi:endonuclease YncB( thermonuclease family)